MESNRPVAPGSRAESSWRGLDSSIELALESWKRGSRPVGLLFSGGVDSSLLAWELRGATDFQLLTVGVPGSRDLASGRSAAQLLGLPWTAMEVSRPLIGEIAREIEPELADCSAVDRSVQTALAVALARSPARELLCGQGIDELFGGYAHFHGLSIEAAARRSDEDLDKLLRRDWPRTLRIAGRFHRAIAAPYLSNEFLSAVRELPSAQRFDPSVPKAFFRGWSVHRGVPESLALRPKRAMQYGTGIDRVLRRTA